MYVNMPYMECLGMVTAWFLKQDLIVVHSQQLSMVHLLHLSVEQCVEAWNVQHVPASSQVPVYIGDFHVSYSPDYRLELSSPRTSTDHPPGSIHRRVEADPAWRHLTTAKLSSELAALNSASPFGASSAHGARFPILASRCGI